MKNIQFFLRCTIHIPIEYLDFSSIHFLFNFFFTASESVNHSNISDDILSWIQFFIENI